VIYIKKRAEVVANDDEFDAQCCRFGGRDGVHRHGAVWPRCRVHPGTGRPVPATRAGGASSPTHGAAVDDDDAANVERQQIPPASVAVRHPTAAWTRSGQEADQRPVVFGPSGRLLAVKR